jgi:hypothetical protein
VTHVKIKINSAWSGATKGVVGLSEVKFEGVPSVGSPATQAKPKAADR